MKDEAGSQKIVSGENWQVTGKPIESVVFEVRAKDGKVLGTLTTDKNGHAETKGFYLYPQRGWIIQGRYPLYSGWDKAADGYILRWNNSRCNSSIWWQCTGCCCNNTLKLVNVPKGPKLQTGDNTNPLLYLGIGALALITGVGVRTSWKKEKNKQ